MKLHIRAFFATLAVFAVIPLVYGLGYLFVTYVNETTRAVVGSAVLLAGFFYVIYQLMVAHFDVTDTLRK
jgi:hypothetical protein